MRGKMFAAVGGLGRGLNRARPVNDHSTRHSSGTLVSRNALQEKGNWYGFVNYNWIHVSSNY